MTILILDDDIDICNLLKMFFEKRHFSVFTAHTLADGLRIINNNEVSILFIDNYLPDGEGWDIAKTIKVKYPELIINRMSSKSKSFDGLENYNNPTWGKPISIQQLETYTKFINKRLKNAIN